MKRKNNIAIFNTFKTRRNKFTGEAKRQRGILAHLATEQSPELRTRTSIAHFIANKHGILWQNIYSGIFRDLDEVLIPSGVVIEGGRLPLRRGPRALQLEGVPFYELTGAGLVVASCIEEIDDRMRLLKDYIRTIPYTDKDESTMFKGLLLLMDIAPAFISKIINEYIYAYTTGVIQNITPINIKKVRDVISNKIGVEREILEAFINSDPVEQEVVRNFFEVVK
ncbi:MAG TPA: hypothetical protein VH500_16215 [Nitrososphaeraceae archaeon]|jgi:hypothetical protein